MSSIMDELRRLQGRRTQPHAPLDGVVPPSEPSPPPEPPAHARIVPACPKARSIPTHIVAILAFALVGLVALLMLPTLGGRRESAAKKTAAAPDTVLAKAERQPPAEPDAARPAETSPGATPEQKVSPPTAPDGASGESSEEPAELAAFLDPIERLPEPRFELASVPAPTDAQPVEETVPADETADTAAGTLEETVTEPARVLTEAEDEANKAAIRGLAVHAVFGDDHGIVVYSSAGELREGSHFNGMDVKQVTTRSVLFECGNKRYRWLLPGRRTATADAGPT